MDKNDNIYFYSYIEALARYPVIIAKMFESETEFNEYKRKATEEKRWISLSEQTQ